LRYAVFSDVHGNQEALDAVLSDAARQHPDAYLCLGDIVGYGPDPNGCVVRVRALGGRAVAGNHDVAATGDNGLDGFSSLARTAIEWTRGVLTGDAVQFLSALPLRVETPAFLAVHASPRDPIDEYILDLPTALAVFAGSDFRTCLVGHTHIPTAFALDRDGRLCTQPLPPDEPVRLSGASRYIVNSGSVGQPRDGDPRASYLLLDTPDSDASVVTLRRLEYPVATTQAKMADRGLPEILARRLASGL
jgi:diadenosine tetraphosphatase ApaH/serine/threonine PP2A family protein phosphatase